MGTNLLADVRERPSPPSGTASGVSGPEQTTVVLALSGNEDQQRRIIELARDQGWRLLDLSFYDGRLPAGLSPRGALVTVAAQHPLARTLRKMGCPAVRIGHRSLPGDNVLPAVVPDHAAVGRLAAAHFAELNFRHVGYVTYAAMPASSLMFSAFETRARELACECHRLALGPATEEKVVARSFRASESLADRQITKWLKQVPKPIGMLGFRDRMAARICAGSLQAGLDVPSEVAVLSRGDSGVVCECAPVPLSSVGMSENRLGEAAFGVLLDLMAGKSGPTEALRVPSDRLVQRASTDTLALRDPLVARAVRYLWNHVEQDVSVEDVVAAVGVSRRGLERAFRQQIGRGINAELRRRRLACCCRLLESTDLSVTAIAPRVGFRSKHYLHTSFRQAYGMSPRQYRLRARRERDGEAQPISTFST